MVAAAWARGISASACLWLTACLVGTPVGAFAPAAGPRGVHTVGVADEMAFEGELLALDDTSLVLLAERPRNGSRILILPFPSIAQADFDQMGGGARILDGVPPPADQLERLRLVGRYPQGISPGLLGRLRRVYQSPTL